MTIGICQVGVKVAVNGENPACGSAIPPPPVKSDHFMIGKFGSNITESYDAYTFEGQPDIPISSVGFANSPDGAVTVFCDQGTSTAHIWDNATESVITTLATSQIRAAAFNDNGTMLATCGDNPEIQLWDTATWTEIVGAFSGAIGGSQVQDVDWVGNVLVFCTTDNSKYFLAFDTSQPMPWAQYVPANQPSSAGQISLSPSGKRMADNRIETGYWDCSSFPFVLLPKPANFYFGGQVSFSPDGTYLITTQSSGNARIFEVTDDQTPVDLGVQSLVSVSAQIVTTAWRRDSKVLSIGFTNSPKAELWDTSAVPFTSIPPLSPIPDGDYYVNFN